MIIKNDTLKELTDLNVKIKEKFDNDFIILFDLLKNIRILFDKQEEEEEQELVLSKKLNEPTSVLDNEIFEQVERQSYNTFKSALNEMPAQ